MPDSRGRNSTRGCISRDTCSDNMSMCDRKLISHRKYNIEHILDGQSTIYEMAPELAMTAADCKYLSTKPHI